MPNPNHPTGESIHSSLSQPSYKGGMEVYKDFLRLFMVMLRHKDGLPTGERLDELAYHLNDDQCHVLHALTIAANRRDNAAIAATVSEEQFQAQRAQRFGVSNPEIMDVPFWVFMVQRVWNAYRERMQFDMAFRDYMHAYSARRKRENAGESLDGEPEPPHQTSYGALGWCFDCFGMALTRLEERHPGETPIYWLDTTTMQICRVETSSANPDWISRHSAAYDTERHALTISGGQIITSKRRNSSRRDNHRSYWLDLTTMQWSHKRR